MTTYRELLARTKTEISEVDARAAQELQGAVHRGCRGGVAEAVRDDDAPVPVVARVGLRVAGHEVQRGVDVARLVVDAQVQLEVRPVARKGIDDRLKAFR